MAGEPSEWAQRHETVQHGAAERGDTRMDGVDADAVEEAQPDRWNGEVVDGAVFEVRRAGASWWYWRPTNAATIVPPENHGRSSLASASRSAIRQPIPVGQPNIL